LKKPEARSQKSKRAAKSNAGQKVRRERSAGFVLFRTTADGPVFLLLDYGQHWDYPKGHLEKGETAWQAAVRELKEETGIRQVDRVGKFQQQMHYTFYSTKKKRGERIAKTVTYFLGKTREKNVTLSDEHVGHAWLSYQEAMERLTYDNARDILRAAYEIMNDRKLATDRHGQTQTGF